MLFQLLTNGIITASVYIIIALGFGIIYSTSRFFNFSYAAIVTIGPYLVLLFNKWGVFPVYVSFFLAVLLCLILGVLLNILIYQPIYRKGGTPYVLFLISLGIYIFLHNAVSLIFGDEPEMIRSSTIIEGVGILDAKITLTQIITLCMCVIIVIVLSIFMRKTNIGMSIRIVANDPVLANISGINSNRVVLWTFAIGSALAGLVGILVALDVDMTPTMGMHALMMGVIVVIIGGGNSISGIVFGALLLAIAQRFGGWFIGSQWQDAIAFVILVLFLLFKPEGFFGKKVRSATV